MTQLLLDPCPGDSQETTSDHPSLDSSLKRPLAQVRFRTSLALAMSLFTQWSNVPLAMDPLSAEWLQISGRENVEIDIKDTTFEDLATTIAKQFGLSLLKCGKSVIIVAPDRLNKRARYEFLLQDNAARVQLSKETLELVCDWFNKVTSAPLERQTRVSSTDDGFVVEGPFPVVLEIRKLLENSTDTGTLQEQDNDGETTISLNFFEPTRLIDVVVAINRLSEDKVFFDWTSLSQMDVTPDTDVSISASHEPLADVLIRLAESIRAEVHRLPSGAFLVSAPHRHSTGFVRLYPVGDFLNQGLTPGQLRERIVKECVPESWADGGGKGILLYDGTANGFVVLNSPNVHQELQSWFEKQRQANPGQ